MSSERELGRWRSGRGADLWDALDLWRFVRVVGADGDCELELPSLVHSCHSRTKGEMSSELEWSCERRNLSGVSMLTIVWADCQFKVEQISLYREVSDHRRRQVQLGQVCDVQRVSQPIPPSQQSPSCAHPFVP